MFLGPYSYHHGDDEGDDGYDGYDDGGDDGDDDGGDDESDTTWLFDHRCNDGSTMEGGNTVICDGHHWNSSAPICLSKFYYNESLL